MNPYAVLNLPKECTDADVREAYQKYLRQCPPEKFPDEFAAISEAAKLLKDETARAQWSLASTGEGLSPEEVLKKFVSFPERRQAPGQDAFRAMLQSCAKVSHQK